MTWKTLGAVYPTELTQTRLQLHWAAQLVSAPGTSLLPAEADDSHTNLGWESQLGVLAGRNVSGQPVRAALVFEALELLVIDDGRERSSMRLAGQTLQQALAWLGEEIAGDASALSLPVYEMPSHSVGEGGVFSDARVEARTELAAWFANAFALIREVVSADPAASPVRCWPHHFDAASLITLDGGPGSEEARSIGVGFCSGDGSYDQPYFYVTPWPYPDTENLPPLAAGAHWHREGWTGAVLTAEHVISVPADEQEHAIRQALERGVAACRELLGA
jgi:hypothetical protein